jgi:hypothetical protein
MERLKLIEAERKGIRIGGRLGGVTGAQDAQAIGKLLSEKPALAGAMENALGPIWCPMKVIDVKDLGENVFLFTFHQSMGKKKAVEGGPWMFDKALLVMEEYDASKAIDEYEFNKIPIWVRIFKLPLGMMSRKTGEDLGNQIGEWMEVDGVENGLAQGQYLRVKVRMPITRPLMRGVTAVVDECGRMKWCPLEYEYLPDFCFVCGIIGHLDRECTIKLKKGEEPQFGRWLRWIPPRKTRLSDNRRTWSDGGSRKLLNWGSGGSKSGGKGSDAPSWRRDSSSLNDDGRSGKGEEKIFTSPPKVTEGGEFGRKVEESATRKLCLEERDERSLEMEVESGSEKGGAECTEGVKRVLEVEQKGEVQDVQRGLGVKEARGSKGKTDMKDLLNTESKNQKGGRGKEELKGRSTFKRQARKESTGVPMPQVTLGAKRAITEMEIDEPVLAKKKREMDQEEILKETLNSKVNAGLSEQLRKQK